MWALVSPPITVEVCLYCGALQAKQQPLQRVFQAGGSGTGALGGKFVVRDLRPLNPPTALARQFTPREPVLARGFYGAMQRMN
jgi:hypothetical protein